MAAKRLVHERQQHCITSFTVSQMTKEADVRSEYSTCWSRFGITVRPVGAGKRTTRGVSTRRTTPVSDEPISLIMLPFIVKSFDKLEPTGKSVLGNTVRMTLLTASSSLVRL